MFGYRNRTGAKAAATRQRSTAGQHLYMAALAAGLPAFDASAFAEGIAAEEAVCFCGCGLRVNARRPIGPFGA